MKGSNGGGGSGGSGNNTNNTDPVTPPKDGGMTTFTIDFELSGDAKEIETKDRDITDRKMTSEDLAVTGHILNSQSGRWSSQNLKGPLQSVLDNTNWKAGNALMVIVDIEQEGTNRMYAYESERS